jgi:hypothetical protein
MHLPTFIVNLQSLFKKIYEITLNRFLSKIISIRTVSARTVNFFFSFFSGPVTEFLKTLTLTINIYNNFTLRITFIYFLNVKFDIY